MSCDLSNEQIYQIVQETLVAVLSATGMQSGREYADAYRQNYLDLYVNFDRTGLTPQEILLKRSEKEYEYRQHREAIRRFVDAIVRPIVSNIGKHDYPLTVNTTTVIEDCYPFFVEVNDSGSAYSILLPHGGDIDLGHIVFGKGTGTSNIQLVAQGGETISGSPTLALSGAYDTVLLARRSNGWTRIALASDSVTNTERINYEFPFTKPAPNNGYLAIGNPATSAVPMLVTRNGEIDTMALSVNAPANGNWTLDVRDAITSTLIHQITLPGGQEEVLVSGIGVAVTAGDQFVVSVNGSTRSNFNRGMARVDILS